ncbi:MAG TPA: hypothetical protein DCS43_11160 [Verrucomicrobia bacterium]|nr:hypothetical protein [Verrucomicrobiota bacterium]
MESSDNPLIRLLDQVPGLEIYLQRIAIKWAKGLPLPARMALGPEPKEPSVRKALDRIFGGRLFYSRGKLTADIPEALRNDAILAPLADVLGIKRTVEKSSATDLPVILQRQRLMYPALHAVHAWLRTSPEIERLLKDRPNQEQHLQALIETATFLRTCERPITLSSLGSTFFNDSKVLRSGTPRKLLGGIMSVLAGSEDTPENRDIALQQFNVIDNPVTTQITLSGPVSLLRNKTKETWIADRFARGEPVTLNSCNLQGVDGVELPATHKTVITSENAAPFHGLVSESHAAIIVYTAGYPNPEVRRMLRYLARAGATCHHWGDTDPDGLRIAAIISAIIPTTLYRCAVADMKHHAKRLKHLDTAQKARAMQMLAGRPDFPFRAELEFSLTNGWLEQESTMH